MKELIKRAFRYCIVGGIASVADYVSYILTVWALNKPDDTLMLCLATTVGFILGLITNYALSLLFVWRVKKDDKTGKTFSDILLFIATGLAGLFLSWLVVAICSEWLHLAYWFSKLVAMALVLAWNFLSRELLIFKRGV